MRDEVMSDMAVIVALTAVIITVIYMIWHFWRLSREEKLMNVRAWLLGAVTLAEKELGSGTGKLKLANAYNQFILTFPKVAAWLPFETFSKMVDEALPEMRRLLESNVSVQAYVTGGVL